MAHAQEKPNQSPELCRVVFVCCAASSRAAALETTNIWAQRCMQPIPSYTESPKSLQLLSPWFAHLLFVVCASGNGKVLGGKMEDRRLGNMVLYVASWAVTAAAGSDLQLQTIGRFKVTTFILIPAHCFAANNNTRTASASHKQCYSGRKKFSFAAL